MTAELAGIRTPDGPRNCRVEHLKLTGFRNYSSASLDFDHRPVVLTGENGAGKTNLLEAVSFLGDGRGLRRARYEEIGHDPAGHLSDRGNPNPDGWAVFGRITGPLGIADIGTGSGQGLGVDAGRRAAKINGESTRSLSELAEHSRILWLTPALDGLFTGGAGDRRRFLDQLVVTVQPDHRKQITAFETAMRQRNALLAGPSPDQTWLEALETQMVEHGVSVSAARVETLSLLSAKLAKRASDKFPSALLNLAGAIEDVLTASSATDTEDFYLSRLNASRHADAAAGRALEGPHRTDLVVHHAGHGIEARKCSTGEQKIVLVALILAHAELTREMTNGYAPILLLDEIGAHLDARHREALFGELLDLEAQAWLTGTDPSLFSALGKNAQHFVVESGAISTL